MFGRTPATSGLTAIADILLRRNEPPVWARKRRTALQQDARDCSRSWLRGSHLSIVLNEYFEENGAIVFREACRLRRHSVEAALSVRPSCASDADLSAAPPHYRCVVARSVF
jgi:hypothetical protein